MNPLEKLTAAAAKIVQIAPTHPEKKSQIALTEAAATIRGTVATIRAALEAEAEKPPAARRFAAVTGDESPLPSAKTSKSTSTKKVSK